MRSAWLAMSWRKPPTASPFDFCVAFVLGIPYRDWMQAGVIAEVEQAAEASLARFRAPVEAEITGPTWSGLGNL